MLSPRDSYVCTLLLGQWNNMTYWLRKLILNLSLLMINLWKNTKNILTYWKWTYNCKQLFPILYDAKEKIRYTCNMHFRWIKFIFKFFERLKTPNAKSNFMRIFTSVLYSQPLQSYCRLSIGDFRGLWFRWSLPSGTPYYYARMTIDTDGQWRAIGNKIYCSRICCTLYKCVGKCCGKIVVSYRLLRFIWGL